MRFRRSSIRPLALALGAPCLGLVLAACSRTSPAVSGAAVEAPSAPAVASPSSATREMRSHFAGVMPRGLTTVGAATLGDALYLVGGYFGSPHDYSKEFQSGTVSRLQLSTGVWEELPAVDPIQSPAVIGDGKYLYKIGGLKAVNAAGQPTELRSVADVERFDTTSSKWEKLPDLPEPRSSMYAVIVGRKLYVVGGWRLHGGMNDNTWSETLLTADLDAPTFTWTSVEMPFQVRAHGLAALGSKIYVIGGLDPASSTDAVHVLDTTTGAWADGPAMPTDNTTPRAAVHEGRLYASGGDGKIYVLSDDGARWDAVGGVRFARLFHEMVPSTRGPLLLAGIPSNNRGGRVRMIERLSPEPAPAGLVMTLSSDAPAKNRQGAFLWSQQLHLFGGNDSLGQHDFAPKNFVAHATRLDLGALEWRPVPALPVARQSLQAVVVGKEEEAALLIGGFGFSGEVLSSHADVYRYDLRKREWASTEARLPEGGLSQFGVARWGGAVWVFGGMSHDARREGDDRIRHSSQILRLDETQGDARFEDAGFALKEPRRAFAGALSGSKYYVVGGLSQGFQAAQGCEVVDLEQKTTAAMPCPPEHRIGADLVALGGKLYLIGGSAAKEGGARESTKRIEQFDPERQSWSELAAGVPFETAEQVRAFVYQDELLLFSSQQSEPKVQVALLDPEALESGNRSFVKVEIPKPVQ